ncbi:MAG: hypothetical protein A2144_00685 [Chloroflexi bacterium RBG_16_50_9]|nr:MAG: hypothetical protein A2144_00685 [Chloroflexi bacterium RBG_16_50_9]
MSRWLIRLIEAAAITVTLAAICQELEKPGEERRWHGKLGFIPYDFRFPTIERFKESFWNPENSRIFTPEVFGIGWAINFYAFLERIRLIQESYTSEEDFLMPTPSLREVLQRRPSLE